MIKIFANLLNKIEVDIISDFELLKKTIISYSLNNEYDKVIDIINKILITNKFNSNDNCIFLYQYLICSLYAVGNKDKAKEILNKFIQILPKEETVNKFILNALYFKISMQTKQYDDAYQYLFLILSKEDGNSLKYFYSQLALLFNALKENYLSRKAFSIFSLMKNKTQLSYEQYIDIANSNIIFAQETKQNKFYELSIFFYKKSLSVNRENNNKNFTALLNIVLNYVELNKFNKAKHYLWLIIKHSKNTRELKAYYQMIEKYKIFSAEDSKFFTIYRNILIFGLKRLEKCNSKQYVWIADNLSEISNQIQDSEFRKIAICFYKKSLKKTRNRKQFFHICMKIQNEFFELKKYKQANIYAKMAIKNTKEKDYLVYANEAMGINYYHLKQYDKSLSYYKHLLSNTDKIPASKIYTALALNYFELKNIKEASMCIKTACSICPTDQEINEIYKKIMVQD